MSLQSFFGDAYYINLDRRPDLNERMQQELTNAGISAERFPAFDIKQMNGKFHYLREKGHVGCLISHMSVMLLAKYRQLDSVLILEDDATFVPDLHERWEQIEKDIPDDWDVLFLGSWSPPRDPSKTKHIQGDVYRSFYALLTHAYAVRRKAYDRILAELGRDVQAVDQVVGSGWKFDLNVYSIHPVLAYQVGHFSETDYRDQRELGNNSELL